MEFKHGQPAKVVDAKSRRYLEEVGRLGRMYQSTVRGQAPYLWIIGTTTHLPLEGPDAVVVELIGEHTILHYQRENHL